ncbi:hypothetical protein ERJ75_000556400 [Trypanosoma vivax]|nr:hypothetical protein ERJ75_000556400 [Trypanosoma vivax]
MEEDKERKGGRKEEQSDELGKKTWRREEQAHEKRKTSLDNGKRPKDTQDERHNERENTESVVGVLEAGAEHESKEEVRTKKTSHFCSCKEKTGRKNAAKDSAEERKLSQQGAKEQRPQALQLSERSKRSTV